MTSDRYGNTKIAKIKAAYDDLRAAVRAGDNEAAQEALDRYEQWADFAFAPQPDLTQAAVAAALEGAAKVAWDQRAYSVGDICVSIRALITDPQHDAMQAVIAAAKAEARAEDAAKIEAIPPLVSTLIQFINALADECETDLDDVVATVRIMPEGREVAEVSATVVIEKLQERLAQIGAKP